MKIQDGSGNGFWAKVGKDKRLHVRALSTFEQHAISRDEAEAYQITADIPILATEQNLLLIENTSKTKALVITFQRAMSIGAAAASIDAYFNIKVGGRYASGGTAVAPVNLNVGNSNDADAIVYNALGTPIVTSGTFDQIDRSYEANKEISYDKRGSIILSKNQSILISHKGSTAAGQAYCRFSFYFDEEA